MPEWTRLKVDILKVIENFVEMYPYPPTECLVIEAIANSLDAKADKITISIYADEDGRRIFRVVDNGKGMTKDEFDENYHALSVSSKVKGEGIGFAGVGSKLYLIFLAAGESIITETKSDRFHGASEISIVDNEPKWTYIDKRSLFHTGTLYEVKLNEKDADFLTPEKTIQIIQTYYNTILLKIYGNITITFNNEVVNPWKPELINETTTPRKFNIRGKEFRCYFWQSKNDLDGRQGIEIVVFGKKVKDGQWFDLDYLIKPQLRNKITGQILADELALLLTTNKCDFRVQTNPALWASFRRKAYDTTGDWLEEINAIEERPLKQLEPKLESLCKDIEKQVNKLLKDPIFMIYNPFLRKHDQSVLIKSELGTIASEEVEGVQKTKGTIGAEGIGHGVKVLGPDEGKSIMESATGEEQGTLVRRRV